MNADARMELEDYKLCRRAELLCTEWFLEQTMLSRMYNGALSIKSADNKPEINRDALSVATGDWIG